VRLHGLIEGSAAAALAEQAADGAMPAGHNGPWGNSETPVRNTGHWLLTFLKAWELSGDPRFAAAAHRACQFLCGPQARPGGATFRHRTHPRDGSNGLIGQAWTIEALVAAGERLGREDCLALAGRVARLHPFEADVGLWRAVEVDGRVRRLHLTFNQQLWFAAMTDAVAARLGDAALAASVRRFLDRMRLHLRTDPTGLIRHAVGARSIGHRHPRELLATLRLAWPPRRDASRLAVGYHAFNLVALALLRGRHPGHPCWRDSRIALAVRFVRSAAYEAALETNPFGYGYNPVGFEVPFGVNGLESMPVAEQARWASRQVARCYDVARHAMIRNSPDPATLAARLCEATRLPDLPLSLRG
jgi:hypothetical protein